MKKGAYDFGRKALYYIVVALFISFIFFYMSSVIKKHNNIVITDLERAESSIMLAEAVISPRCFVYEDKETGRAYPGFIDIKKFNADNIGKGCFPYLDSNFKFEIGNKQIAKGEGADEIVHSPVLIVEDGKIRSGMLNASFIDYYAVKGQKTPRMKT